jgi:hypothetical protein
MTLCTELALVKPGAVRRWTMTLMIMATITVGLLWFQTMDAGPTHHGASWLLAQRFNGSNSTEVGSRARLPPFQNITGKVMDELARNGTGPCYEQRTNNTKVIGLPETLTLPTNVVHRFWLQSHTSAGAPRCAGGDYYELDLSSPLWKSRPRIHDLLNGTYAVDLSVPDAYAGPFTFSAHLLFDSYHGLDFHPEDHKIVTLMVSLAIDFTNSTNRTEAHLTLQRCDPRWDFSAHEWSGRWTRPVDNDTCEPDAAGRYAHCFSGNVLSKTPSWSSGDVARLESGGWSYSAHCAFHVFAAQEAWDCLAGRWLFFWGDSNHQDTVRNLITFVLGIDPPPGRDLLRFAIDRSFQNWFRNPGDLNQEVRITSQFNGHPMMDGNGMGLDSLNYPHYRDFIASFFAGQRYPDTVIMNSGLHDGVRFHDVPAYVRSVESALSFWSEMLGNVSGVVPQVLYRTTVAPAGASRAMQANAHKMEVYNRIATENVQLRFPEAKLVDEFDMTFPFHYDNNCSDGGHYGRPPRHKGDNHNHYFVDVMLSHVLLNALCPRAGTAS